MLNVPSALADFMRQRGPYRPEPGLPLHRLLQTKKAVHTIDQATEKVRPLLPSCRCAIAYFGTDAQGGRADRRDFHLSPRGAAVHRQADRAADEFRRPGGHRHREHAAAQRAARVACSSRPRPPTCSRSSAARPSICRRCSTRWPNSPRSFPKRTWRRSFVRRALPTTGPRVMAYRRNMVSLLKASAEAGTWDGGSAELCSNAKLFTFPMYSPIPNTSPKFGKHKEEPAIVAYWASHCCEKGCRSASSY